MEHVFKLHRSQEGREIEKRASEGMGRIAYNPLYGFDVVDSKQKRWNYIIQAQMFSMERSRNRIRLPRNVFHFGSDLLLLDDCF